MTILSRILRSTYWITDFLKGSPVRRQYNDVRIIHKNYAEGERRRSEYLRSMLNFAVSHSNFYKPYNPESLLSFPVLNKQILRDNYTRVLVEQKFIPHQKGPLYIQRTSGSTGTPFAVPQDTRKRIRRLAELKYYGELVGFRSHERLIQLRIWTRWQNKSKLQILRENIIPFDISSFGDARIEKLCHMINKKRVFAIRGYASSFELLANFVRKNGIRLPTLKVAIAGSESLHESVRELFMNQIGCPIVSQYANEENGILAQEGLDSLGGGFYVNYASYYVELLKLDSDIPAEVGEIGRVVLTDLFNYAFPIIRYDTGDTAVLGKGNHLSLHRPMLSQLYGRRLDLVYDTKGDPVSPMTLGRILRNYSDILQWQFVQKNRNTYVLYVILSDSRIGDSCIIEIINLLRMVFGTDSDIHVESICELPVLSSGKRKAVVCEL